MFHYFETLTNTRGDSLANWQVEVVDLETGSVVDIFADESSTPIVTASGIANRAVTDEEGNFDFFVPSGTYSLQIYDPAGVFNLKQRYVPMYGSIADEDFATYQAIQVDVQTNADQVAADRALAEAAALAAQAEVGANASWYVSPSVTGATAGTGTLADPFSPEHAFSGGSGDILPGHTIWLRGGTYKPSVHCVTAGPLFRWAGFRVTVSGTAESPVVIREYPGEKAVFDDPVTWSSISININNPGQTVYETGADSTLEDKWVGGSYRVAGKWYPLVSYRNDALTALQATTSIWNTAGNYYVGPGVLLRPSTDRIRIRLNDPYLASEDPFFAAEDYGDTPVQPVSTDPALADLALFRQDQIGVQLDGDFIEWRGTQIDGFYALIRVNGDGCKVLDLVSKRCPYIGVHLFGTDWVVGGDKFDIDGNLHETGTHLAWGDIKNGNEVAVQNRAHAIPIESGPGRICGRFRIRNFFDGSVIARPDVEIGGPVDTSVLDGLTGQARENALWASAGKYINMWDDAWQITHRAQRLEIHHVICEGAGPSRDGTGSTTDYGDDFPNIHHCIFNARATRIMWNRRGRNSTRTPALPEPDAPGATFNNNNEAGRQHPLVVSAHGPNGGVNDWLFPWFMSYCTIIVGDDLDVDRRALNIASFNPTAGKRHGVLNRVSNCLIIDRGLRGGNSFSGNVRYLNLQRITTTVPTDIFDGNVFVYEEDPPLRFQLFTTSAGDLNSQITSAAELQSGTILADVQEYYANGWENVGFDIQGTLEDVLDPVTYRPRLASIKTGAVDLTLTELPGLEYYQAQHAALAPLEEVV